MSGKNYTKDLLVVSDKNPYIEYSDKDFIYLLFLFNSEYLILPDYYRVFVDYKIQKISNLPKNLKQFCINDYGLLINPETSKSEIDRFNLDIIFLANDINLLKRILEYYSSGFPEIITPYGKYYNYSLNIQDKILSYVTFSNIYDLKNLFNNSILNLQINDCVKERFYQKYSIDFNYLTIRDLSTDDKIYLDSLISDFWRYIQDLDCWISGSVITHLLLKLDIDKHKINNINLYSNNPEVIL